MEGIGHNPNLVAKVELRLEPKCWYTTSLDHKASISPLLIYQFSYFMHGICIIFNLLYLFQVSLYQTVFSFATVYRHVFGFLQVYFFYTSRWGFLIFTLSVIFIYAAPTIIIAHEFYDALPIHQFQVCFCSQLYLSSYGSYLLTDRIFCSPWTE